MKVIIVGSGGGEEEDAMGMEPAGPSAGLLAAASLLCARRRVIRISCRCETRLKGVMLGRWRCASLMAMVKRSVRRCHDGTIALLSVAIQIEHIVRCFVYPLAAMDRLRMKRKSLN